MAYNQSYYGGGYFQNGAMQGVLEQYKGQYQQPMTQAPILQAPIQPITQPKPTNDIIWVQGEAGAKGYLVAPNNTVVLWDTETPTIYVKTADASGLPTMRVLDFTERTETIPQTQKNTPQSHECKCSEKFVLKTDFEELRARFEDMAARIEEITLPKTTGKKAKESE